MLTDPTPEPEPLTAEELTKLRSEAEAEADYHGKHGEWQRLVLRLVATLDAARQAPEQEGTAVWFTPDCGHLHIAVHGTITAHCPDRAATPEPAAPETLRWAAALLAELAAPEEGCTCKSTAGTPREAQVTGQRHRLATPAPTSGDLTPKETT